MGACSSTPATAPNAYSPPPPPVHKGEVVPSALREKSDRDAAGSRDSRVSFSRSTKVDADGAAAIGASVLGDPKTKQAAEANESPPPPPANTTPTSTASTDSSASSPGNNNNNHHNPFPDPAHNRLPSQDVSLGDSALSVDSNSSHSSIDNGTSGRSSANNSSHGLGSSHRRRKSRQLTHSDSKLGLNEIICGDLKNPNLVRIEVPLGKPIEEVYEGVHDGPVLGSGISGIVRLVKHRATQVSYAVKCLDLALIDSEEGLKQLKEEIYIMCQLDHPNIVRLEEVYESHSEIYLVQEVCKGGELFDRLDEQPDYHYTEAQCARLVKQMLSSVRYIHNKGIIHRDLKLENFLFSEMEAGSELKMIDFGLSKHFTFGEVQHEAVGTPYTVAPEVIRGSYDERCDVWAIGVITYLLLSGEPPFGGCGGPETLLQVRDNILRGAFQFEPVEIWETVSQEAKDFIKSLLVIDPMDRPTARQAKESKWLKMWSNRENNGNGDSMINPNVVKALVGFKEYSDMRKLLCEVLSFTLLPEQIQGLRTEFEKYDRDGTGEITLSTLKKVLIGNASTGSLGGLTEQEVVDIFNAMRVRKGETSIHWHDFIAAGLSQCQVDDRNLRLAFERLDQERKGYITIDNVMDLMGDEMGDDEDQMLQMWGESMKDVNCKTSLINYEDFVLLMKGQKRERERFTMRTTNELALSAVPETSTEDDDEHASHTPLSSFNEKESPVVLPLQAEDEAPVGKPKLSPKEVSPVLSLGSPGRPKNFVRMGSNSAPATPGHVGKRFDDIEQGDSPLSMDEVEGRVSFSDQYAVFTMPDLDLTPPQTPVRGPADYVTPTVARATLDPVLISHLTPPDLSLPGLPGDTALSIGTNPSLAAGLNPLTSSVPPLARAANPSTSSLSRGRSVSMDEKETYTSKVEAESRRSTMFKRDSRRAMAIPEHTHNVSDIDKVIEDKTKTPLVVNRKLYRAHREFRHAVTEACKRFEDEQMRRAKETLQAQESAISRHTAGLVMRHGQALSEQSIKSFLKKTLEEQQAKVDSASRRGGRGRRSRKKTVSDMSGMMGGPALPSEAAVDTRKTVDHPKQEALSPVKENENLLRNPTKPGEFRKTNYDPFQRKISIFENGIRKSSIGSIGDKSPVMGMPPNPPPPPPL